MYEHNINESLKNYLFKYFHKLNLNFMINRDIALQHLSPDIIHDLRVSSRRLLSFLEIAQIIIDNKNKYLKKLDSKISYLLNSLSKLRDCQVQLLALEKYAFELYIPDEFTNYIRDIEKKELIKAKNIILKYDIVKHLKYIEKISLQITFSDMPDEDLINHCKSSINTSVNNCAQLLNKAEKDDLCSIHKFRLAFKNFRYLMEISSKLYNLKKKELNILGLYQDILGKIQDNNQMSKKARLFVNLRNGSFYQNAIDGLSKMLENELIKPVDRFLELKEDFYKLANSLTKN